MELVKKCSSWQKVDLHIHSIYSCEARAKLPIKQIFEEAIVNNVKLISITDHNNVDGLDEAIIESENYKDKLTFLPGIEFKTDKGDKSVHAIAIFPIEYNLNGQTGIINKQFLSENLLSPLGLTRMKIEAQGSGKYEEGLFNITVDFEEMAEKVHELGGLVIVHATKSNGLEKEMDHCKVKSPDERDLLASLGTKKEELLNKYIDICEIRNWGETELKQQAFYLEHFNKPSVVFSDAHAESEVGKQYSWIKMDDASFEGLKQILFEPKLRLILGENAYNPNYQYLLSVNASGGYYKDIQFEFCPELNIIIGPRGSGKSVLIDLMKFAFGKYSKDDKESQPFLHRLYELLRYNNSVSVKFIDKTNNLITYIRKLDITADTKNKNLLIDNSEEVPESISNYFEVYGQGEMKDLLKRTEAKLKLLDELGDSFSEKEKIDDCYKNLKANELKQKNLLIEITPLIDQVNKRNKLVKYAEDTQNKLSGFNIQEYINREERNKYYNLYLKNLDRIKEQFSSSQKSIEKYFDCNKSNDTIIAEFQVIYEQNCKKLIQVYDTLSEIIESSKAELKNLQLSDIGLWEEYYNTEQTKFVEMLKGKNIENVIDETNKLKQYQSEILEIDMKESKELGEKATELFNLQKSRSELIETFHKLNSELRENRIRRCEVINANEILNSLKVSIDKVSNKKLFEEFLNKLLSGKGIRNLEEQISLICKNTHSILAIVELLKENDIGKLSSNLKITSNTASVLLSLFSDEVGLCNYEEKKLFPVNDFMFELESIIFEDIVHMEASDPISKKYKDIKRFSQGQQCSYLLGLLLSSSKNTLVIDQPEDDLDWNYIQDFVNKLRSLKVNQKGDGRQFIFATHNQNITVLADGEKIYYLNNKSTDSDDEIPSGMIVTCGGLEREKVKKSVLSLEGGEQAFNKRRAKYGIR